MAAASRVAAVLAVLLPPALVAAGTVPPAACLVSVAGVAFWIVLRLRGHAAPILLVFIAAALLTAIAQLPWLNWHSARTDAEGGRALAREWQGRSDLDSELPVVIHLVFDELMSPGAIDTQLPGADALHADMRTLATHHRLRLFDSVYSRHFFSGVSIPNLVNAEYEGRTQLRDLVTAVNEVVPANAYFTDMAARGYRTAVFQSALLDFCSMPDVQLCDTFQSFDPGVVDDSRSDDRTRTVYLWNTILRAYEPSYLSRVGRWLLKRMYGLDQMDLGVLGTADRFDVQGFTGWFERLSQFVVHAPRGTHVFAHVLVPHSPYLLTEDCFVSGEFDSGYYLQSRFPDEHQRYEARRRFYALYFKQARCLMSNLDTLLRAIEDAPALHDAVLVIHGDHGARISAGALVEEQGPADMIDNYATFFAVRAPSVAPGLDCTFTSLGQVVREHLHGADVPPRASAPLPVVVRLEAATDASLEMPMPLFGCAKS